LALSNDGGATWSTQIVASAAGEGGTFTFPEGYTTCGVFLRPFKSRPAVAYGPNGTLYYVYTPDGNRQSSRVYITRSSDGGTTFDQPKLVDPSVPQDRNDYLPDVAVDQGSGRVYVSWSRYGGNDQHILSASSGDRGQTFSAPIRVSPRTHINPEENQPAVGPDGKLYVSYFDKGLWYASVGVQSGTFYVATSSNGGQTFGAPVQAGTAGSLMCNGLQCEIHYDDLSNLYAIAAGRSPGQLFMVWHDRLLSGRYRIFFAASGDAGATWASPKVVGLPSGSEGNDQHRPGIAVAPNGRIDLAYYDLTPDVFQDVYSISSCDRGATFSAPQKLTSVSYDATIGPRSFASRTRAGTAPPERFSLFGEAGVVSTDARLAAAWTDSRRGTRTDAKQDVFSAALDRSAACAGPGPGPGPGPGGDSSVAVPATGAGGDSSVTVTGTGGAQLGAPPGGASTGPGAAAQALRARAFRSCLVRAARHTRLDLAAARRGSLRARALARRHLRRHRAAMRRRCVARHGRTPGRVTGLRASAAVRKEIVLSFRAPGSDRNRPPPARGYLVKQSTSPITDLRSFRRARKLCNGTCRFPLTRVGEQVKLRVTDLRPNRTYYYAIAARDNVTRRLGPRSRAVRARTR